MCLNRKGVRGWGRVERLWQRGLLKHKSISGGPRALRAPELPFLDRTTLNLPFFCSRNELPWPFQPVCLSLCHAQGSRDEYRLRFNLYANECLVFTEPRAHRLCFRHNFRGPPSYNKRVGCDRRLRHVSVLNHG